jgi:hypothetical protein
MRYTQGGYVGAGAAWDIGLRPGEGPIHIEVTARPVRSSFWLLFRRLFSRRGSVHYRAALMILDNPLDMQVAAVKEGHDDRPVTLDSSATPQTVDAGWIVRITNLEGTRRYFDIVFEHANPLG